MQVHLKLTERAIVLIDNLPVKYLKPGRHTIWNTFLRKVEVKRYDTTQLKADLRGEELSLVPSEDLRVVTVRETERALVTRRGRPALWLGPGVHQIWTVEKIERRAGAERELIPGVTIELIDVSGIDIEPLRDEVKSLVPAGEYVETTAPEGQAVVRYVDGALEAVLGVGRKAAWSVVHKVQLVALDLRERIVPITGQEVMTKDRVSLRLNLSVSFKVTDVRRSLTVAKAPEDALYLAVQLSAREVVATRTLDEILALRESLSLELRPMVAARAESLGLSVIEVGLKDLVLPGDMKALLNRVIEAQKEAEANVILRREETAATRSMAQTAKVLAENPLLIRLKELEAYKELAAKVGNITLVVGKEGLPQLQLAPNTK
ncbi:MAG: slipin family protein [Deltaproteobacteria bacterium]|nr:slipin family protein [Deltaproteobacteria bacterium]